MQRRWWLSLMLVGAASIAPSLDAQTVTPDSARAADTTQRKIRRRANIISREELDAAPSSIQTVYEAIQQLRPAMLQTRAGRSAESGDDGRTGGDNSSGGIAVYTGGTRLGDINELRNVPIQQVASIQRLSASDATTRFGTGHPMGAIVIINR
jgi:hypothetical protein